MFSTSLRLTLAQPEDALGPLCSHLAEHEAVVTRLDDRTRISLGNSEAWLTVRGETVDIVIQAPGLAGLKEMKWAIASHLAEFAPPGTTAGFCWSGDASGPSLPPDFRVLTVTGTEQITPHMRRIRFHGEDLARFDTMEALHVRLFIPPASLADPAWPLLGDDGILRQPPLERRPAIRKYTIREIDAAAGTLAIDFVVHDDAGPGSAFAVRARAGDVVGMAGPGGRGLKQADHYLFLADETGLPAVARMLGNLPRTARGLAIIEIADSGEQQPLDAPEGIAIRWLERDGAASGSATLLPDAFAALGWPPEGERLYLWAALEYAAFRQIRSAARERLRPGQDEHLIVSYWRAGMAEEQHAAQKKLAAGAA